MKNIKLGKFVYVLFVICCLSIGFFMLFGCGSSAQNPYTEKTDEYTGNIMLRVAVDDLHSIVYYVETRTGVMYCTKGIESGLEEMHDPRTGKLLLYEDWVLYPVTYDKYYPVANN